MLIDKNIFANRSEIVRLALQDFLIDEIEMFKDLDPKKFEKLIGDIKLE